MVLEILGDDVSRMVHGDTAEAHSQGFGVMKERIIKEVDEGWPDDESGGPVRGGR